MTSAVEKAEQTCLDSWCRVVVGSVQSLQRPARLEQFPADYFGTIIIDEAHHAITDGYQRVLEHFPEANVLGVTATPDRGDIFNRPERHASRHTGGIQCGKRKQNCGGKHGKTRHWRIYCKGDG